MAKITADTLHTSYLVLCAPAPKGDGDPLDKYRVAPIGCITEYDTETRIAKQLVRQDNEWVEREVHDVSVLSSLPPYM